MLSNFSRVLLLMFFVSMPAHANTRVYEAPLTSAAWDFASEAGLQCRLYQDIPDYGKAEFTGKVGKVQDMNFSLTVERNQPTKYGVATIKSIAPVWRQDLSSRELGQTTVSPEVTPVRVKNAEAWRLLTELEQGMSPAFYYDGWIDGEDQVVVSLSPIGFFSVYKKFVNCIAGMSPFSSEDVANSLIYFQSGKSAFTEEARSRLKKISTYLQENGEQQLVLVQGHADSQGDHSFNDTLSRNRAEAVKQFLVQGGVDKAKIQTRSYGEREPVESNVTDEGRLKNRRVVIQVGQ